MVPGEGQGLKHDEPLDSLSALIEAMNEPFGAGLAEVDQIAAPATLRIQNIA